MKVSALALAAIGVQAVAGQAIADYFPECSVDCVTNVLYTSTDCAEGDFACLCLHSNQYKIFAAAEECSIAACGYDVAQQQVLPAAKPFCAAVGAAFSSTATQPLPVDTAFNDYKTRRTQTAAVTSAAATSATPMSAASDIPLADYFPACAVDCISDVIFTATLCEQGDLVCACLHGNQYKIYAAAEQCAIDACGYDVAQQDVLPAAKPYCAAINSAYLATATAPLPSDTAFEDYKTRRTQTTAVTSATSVPTSPVDLALYFPECSIKCISDVIFTATSCAQGDFVCGCLHSNQYAIFSAAETCVIEACGYDVAQQSALPAAKPYCSAVNEEYLATATAPLPSDTAFEGYKTRRTQTTVATTGVPTPTAGATVPLGDYFPECAVSCISNVIFTSTTCEQGDYVCGCLHSNQYKIYEASEECVIAACGYDVAQCEFFRNSFSAAQINALIETVLPAAKTYCAAVNEEYLATATAPLPSDTAFEDYKTRRTMVTSTVPTGSAAQTSGAPTDSPSGNYTVIVSGTVTTTVPCEVLTTTKPNGQTVVISGTHTVTLPCPKCEASQATPTTHHDVPEGYTVVVSGTVTMTVPCSTEGQGSHATASGSSNKPSQGSNGSNGFGSNGSGSNGSGSSGSGSSGSGSGGSGSGSGSGSGDSGSNNGSGSGANPTTIVVVPSTGSSSHDGTSTETPAVIVNGAAKAGSVGLGAVLALGALLV